jgi:hypothetical protein
VCLNTWCACVLVQVCEFVIETRAGLIKPVVQADGLVSVR